MRWLKRILENQKIFCLEQTHSQKPLSVFQHLLSFERFEFIFVAYFQGLNYLIISCFIHKFAARISINLRGILKHQERFLFITYSFKKMSLSFFTGVPDREIWRCLWDPMFSEIRQISPNPICYFWVNCL